MSGLTTGAAHHGNQVRAGEHSDDTRPAHHSSPVHDAWRSRRRQGPAQPHDAPRQVVLAQARKLGASVPAREHLH